MRYTVERDLKADEGQEGWEQGESRIFRKEGLGEHRPT